ncbi:MAG: DNA gyrase inhibitor YacG [Polyangiaceae bacterium]
MDLCPICHRPAPQRRQVGGDPASSCAPFCSTRCRQIDLGQWLDGAYRVPIAEDSEVESQSMMTLAEDEA